MRIEWKCPSCRTSGDFDCVDAIEFEIRKRIKAEHARLNRSCKASEQDADWTAVLPSSPVPANA